MSQVCTKCGSSSNTFGWIKQRGKYHCWCNPCRAIYAKELRINKSKTKPKEFNISNVFPVSKMI